MKKLMIVLFLVLITTVYSGIGYELLFYHNNHQGSPIALIDSHQNKLWTTNYELFGSPFNELGKTDLKFNSKELDDSGLFYFGARFYDSIIGRFITPDFAENFPNPYSYTDNNPIKYIDPSGKRKSKTLVVSSPELYNKGNFGKVPFNVLSFSDTLKLKAYNYHLESLLHNWQTIKQSEVGLDVEIFGGVKLFSSITDTLIRDFFVDFKTIPVIIDSKTGGNSPLDILVISAHTRNTIKALGLEQKNIISYDYEPDGSVYMLVSRNKATNYLRKISENSIANDGIILLDICYGDDAVYAQSISNSLSKTVYASKYLSVLFPFPEKPIVTGSFVLYSPQNVLQSSNFEISRWLEGQSSEFKVIRKK